MLFDVVVTRVLDDAFANPERQIEPAMCGVALFKVLDDAKSMQVVVEAPPMTSEATIQRSLTRVSEGWMTDVVNQCKCLGEVFVQAESGCSGPGDLRDLNRVGQTAAKMIGRPRALINSATGLISMSLTLARSNSADCAGSRAWSI